MRKLLIDEILDVTDYGMSCPVKIKAEFRTEPNIWEQN